MMEWKITKDKLGEDIAIHLPCQHTKYPAHGGVNYLEFLHPFGAAFCCGAKIPKSLKALMMIKYRLK